MTRFGAMKTIMAFGLLFGLAQLVAGQNQPDRREIKGEKGHPAKVEPKPAPKSKTSSGGEKSDIRAGTKFSAQLESSLDAKTAKPGDEVAARVTQNVKQNGRVVIHKGDRMVGHITEVKSAASAGAGSEMNVVFDHLVSGETTTQLAAVVASLISTPSEERERGESSEGEEPMLGPGPAPAARGSRGGGGLVGGLAGSVGGTVGAVTGVAGDVSGTVNSTTRSTVGNATGADLSTPLRAIRVNSDTQGESSIGAGSVLSTRQGNLRLESGTRIEFRVAAQGSAESR